MKHLWKLTALSLALLLCLSACGKSASTEQAPSADTEGPGAEAVQEPTEAAVAAAAIDPNAIEAIYLGVLNYGGEGVDKEHRDTFLYRFLIDGEERALSVDNGQGTYPVQNQLKEDHRFALTMEGDTVTAVQELDSAVSTYLPPVSGVPGTRTVANFLKTALEPVGTTLYIYGGGWDWQDEGSSVQATTLGVSPDWVQFFDRHDESYTFKEVNGDTDKADPANSYFPYGGYNEYYYAGLDCSGYLGWTVYNTAETQSGKSGYVRASTGFARSLSELGWGTWTQDVDQKALRPGDVMSINGHVWISLGSCPDGSTVILHCTPSRSRAGQPGGGVQISAIGPDESCQAYALAEQYISKYFPAWYQRYPVYLCSPESYFAFEGEQAGLFTWNTDSESSAFTDPEGIQSMDAAQVLETLFAGAAVPTAQESAEGTDTAAP